MLQIKKIDWVSATGLLVANLVPLYGLAFKGWQLYSILFLFWFESAVIGFFNVLKIWRASAPEPVPLEIVIGGKKVSKCSTGWMAVFFAIHYGMFMAVHLMILNSLFQLPQFPIQQIWPAMLCLIGSHGLSYVLYFLRGQEYLRVSPGQQLFRPYSRIVAMHMTVLVGGVITRFTGASVGLLLFLVVAKIAADLTMHVQEHAKFPVHL